MKKWKSDGKDTDYPTKRKGFFQILKNELKKSPNNHLNRKTTVGTEMSTDMLSRNGDIMNDEMKLGGRNQPCMKYGDDRPNEVHRSVEMERLSNENKILKAKLLNVKEHNKKLIELCKRHNIQDDLLKEKKSLMSSSHCDDKIATYRQVFASREKENVDETHDKERFNMEEQINYSSKTRRMSNLSWENNESIERGNTENYYDKERFNMEKQINYSSNARRMSNLSWETNESIERGNIENKHDKERFNMEKQINYSSKTTRISNVPSKNKKTSSEIVFSSTRIEFPKTITVTPELRLSEISCRSKETPNPAIIPREPPNFQDSFMNRTPYLMDINYQVGKKKNKK